MTQPEALEWLRYGALGFSGLALTSAAGLLATNHQSTSVQWNQNIRLFMVFATALAIVAAVGELLEHIYPDPARTDALLIQSVKDYTNSLRNFSNSKHCLDDSLIANANAKRIIINMLDNMDDVIKQLAQVTGQKLSASPPCKG